MRLVESPLLSRNRTGPSLLLVHKYDKAFTNLLARNSLPEATPL